MLGKNFINVLSDEKIDNYTHGYITENCLKRSVTDLSKHVYLCGPPVMMDIVETQLIHMNVDKNLIIKEGF